MLSHYLEFTGTWDVSDVIFPSFSFGCIILRSHYRNGRRTGQFLSESDLLDRWNRAGGNIIHNAAAQSTVISFSSVLSAIRVKSSSGNPLRSHHRGNPRTSCSIAKKREVHLFLHERNCSTLAQHCKFSFELCSTGCFHAIAQNVETRIIFRGFPTIINIGFFLSLFKRCNTNEFRICRLYPRIYLAIAWLCEPRASSALVHVSSSTLKTKLSP